MSRRPTRNARTDLPADPPPHNVDAERGVLGSMLLDRDAIERAGTALRPEDFYHDAHRLIFSAILDLFERGQPADLVTVPYRLTDTGKLDEVGGAPYVVALPNGVPTAANVGAYIEIVREQAQRRALLTLGQALQHGALNGGVNPETTEQVRALLDKAEMPRAARLDPPALDGGALLGRIDAFLRRFVAFASSHQATAVVLWIVHAHAIDAAEATAYLAVTSAEKQSGKSRLLETIELLVPRPWRTVRPSEAVLFRVIADRRPTLLLDETDAIFSDKVGTYEGHRALLNAGHRRGASVSRCVGEGKEIVLREFPVFGAKALAGIGELPDTVADRSIPIRLVPRLRDAEPVERFRFRSASRDAEPIRTACECWALEHLDRLREARPVLPTAISDRAADGWEPLLAIADLASAGWPDRARAAAAALHGNPLAQTETAGVALLRAIREIFEAANTDQLTTARLLAALVDRDDGPWAEWWGKSIAEGKTKGPGSRLAYLLRRYWITSKNVRAEDGKVLKGYAVAAFKDAFDRYLPSFPPEERYNATILDTQGPAGQNENATDPPCSVTQMALQPLINKECSVVAFANAQEGGGDGDGQRTWLRAMFPDRAAWIAAASPAEIAAAVEQAETGETTP